MAGLPLMLSGTRQTAERLGVVSDVTLDAADTLSLAPI
jgi:hypothetical protein